MGLSAKCRTKIMPPRKASPNVFATSYLYILLFSLIRFEVAQVGFKIVVLLGETLLSLQNHCSHHFNLIFNYLNTYLIQ